MDMMLMLASTMAGVEDPIPPLQKGGAWKAQHTLRGFLNMH